MNGQWFPNGAEALGFLERRNSAQERQKASRKFMEDHQLIHSRKKNEPCIPILPGHDQEAWFARLDSNGVFNVLRGTGHLQYFGFGRHVSKAKKDENREILNQRLVSKSWKKSVEEVFLVPLKWTPQEPFWHPDNWYWHSPLACCFDEISKVENAFEKLKNVSSCETLIRVVKVDDRFVDDKETFYMNLAKFLDVHGSSVWGLMFNNTYSNYDHLCQVLSSLPHLKALRLYSDYPDHDESTYARIGSDMIWRNPLPILPELVLADLHYFCTKGEYLVAEILSKSPNLKAVHLERFNLWNGELDDPMPGLVWSELQNLRLEYFCSYGTMADMFIDDFHRLKEMNWPLKFLDIMLPSHVEVEDINCSDIVETLSRYNDSLIEFNVQGGFRLRSGLVPDEKSVVVDLPNLKGMFLPPIRSNWLDDDEEPDSSSSEHEDY